jgi:hypothetical protein
MWGPINYLFILPLIFLLKKILEKNINLEKLLFDFLSLTNLFLFLLYPKLNFFLI